MSEREHKPRLSIDLTLEQRKRLTEHMQWGMQRVIFSFIIDELINYFDRYGANKVIGALVSRSIELKDLLKLQLED